MLGMDCSEKKSDLDKYSNGAKLIGFPRTEYYTVEDRRAFKYEDSDSSSNFL